MRPGEINPQNYDEFVKQARARFDPMKAKMRASFENGSAYLKKFKMEPGSKYAMLVPLEMTLPFDPQTLSEEMFNIDNPLPLPGSPTTAVRNLKKMAKENAEFAKKLAECLEVKVDALNTDVDSVDAREIRMWHKLARIQIITGYVQHLNTRKDKFPFGRNVGVEPVLNDEGDVTDTVGAGGRLYHLESALISIEIQRINDSYEEGGVNADRPQKDKEAEIKTKWKERLIGNPYPIAFTRVIPFSIDNNSIIENKEINEWSKNRKVQNLIRYQKIIRDRINTFESVLMSRNDIHMDFVEIHVDVPKEDPQTNKLNYQQINYAPAAASNSIFLMDEEVPGKPTPINNLSGLKEEFIKLRDNDKVWNDDNLRKSIIEYRIPGDQTLLAELANELSAYEDAMKSSAILKDYGDIIDKLDTTLTSKIAESLLDGVDNAPTISQEIIDSQPIMDETTDPTESLGNDIGDLLNDVLGDDDNN